MEPPRFSGTAASARRALATASAELARMGQTAPLTGGDDIGPIRGYMWTLVFRFAFYAVSLNIVFVIWWLLP